MKIMITILDCAKLPKLCGLVTPVSFLQSLSGK